MELQQHDAIIESSDRMSVFKSLRSMHSRAFRMTKRRRKDCQSLHDKANADDACEAQEVLGAKICREKGQSDRIYYRLSAEEDSWVEESDVPIPLIHAWKQANPDDADKIAAAIQMRKGGRPPSVTRSTAVGSAVAALMLDFLKKNPSFGVEEMETWKCFMQSASQKRCHYCSIETILEHAKSDPFQFALSQSRINCTAYEPEDPKTKAFTRYDKMILICLFLFTLFRYKVWIERMKDKFWGHCEMCGVQLNCLQPSGWHCAHNVAWTKGGSHEIFNRRVSCPTCNMSTSTLTFDQAQAFRATSSSFVPFLKKRELQDVDFEVHTASL